MVCFNCSTTASKRFITTKENKSLCLSCYKKINQARRSEYIIKKRKEHYQNNKEKILEKGKEYAKTNAYGYSYCKSNAKRRNILFELTREQYDAIVVTGCYYCEEKNLPQYGARIDRLDSNMGYLFENCVCACSRCNYLKGDILTVEETKAAIQALKQYHIDGILPEKIIFGLYNTTVKRIRKLEYNKVVTYAKKENIECSLTKDEYMILTSKFCYYCSGSLSQSGYGIDRKDPQGPYSLDNCVPCCPICNKIKWKIFTSEETLVIVNTIQKLRKIHGQKQVETKSRGARAFTEYHTKIKKDAYTRTENILIENNLELLTSFEEYTQQINHKKMMTIKCLNQGHVFERSFERANKIMTCPDCTNKSNKHGGFLKKLEAKGWKYIEGKYINKLSILKVICKNGHILETQYRYLRDKACAICEDILYD